MAGWFSKHSKIEISVDIHSHLLPGLDDGVGDYEEALEIARSFARLGFRKLVTTPHIYTDHYPNTPADILGKLDELREHIAHEGIDIVVEAAAEYYIDHHFLDTLDRNDTILSFGKERYVLMETGFHTKPIIFDEVVFKLKAQNYVPVLAHPERYFYLEENLSWLRQIRERGVCLQVSIPSLGGLYGKTCRKIAKRLLKVGLVDFLGSDIHHQSQLADFEKSLSLAVPPHRILNEELL